MTHSPRPPFSSTSGPSSPRLVFLGEAWGETEQECHRPFAGESGKELWRMMGEAMPEVAPELHREICDLHAYGVAWVKRREEWLEVAGAAFTNVLAFRPPNNKLEDLCSSKKEVGEYAGSFAPLARGKYLREEFLPELDRLHTELATWRPNLVVALGNTAIWALLQATNIGSIRGAITSAAGVASRAGNSALDFERPVKVLPTYHPAGVLRQWAWRPIVVADLMKAHREATFPEIRRPIRRVLVDPSIEEVEAWTGETLRLWESGRVQWLSPDVETASGQITCIGFARSHSEAMVVPFWDHSRPGYHYWPDRFLERRAWDCVAALLESHIPKVGQNFIYDLQYINKVGIQPKALQADTMLLHHSIFPEMQKGLGFLGSIYTNESSWKLLRKRKADTEKKDE